MIIIKPLVSLSFSQACFHRCSNGWFPLGAGHHDTFLKLEQPQTQRKRPPSGKFQRMATLTNESGLIIGKSTMITLYWHHFEPCQSDFQEFLQVQKIVVDGSISGDVCSRRRTVANSDDHLIETPFRSFRKRQLLQKLTLSTFFLPCTAFSECVVPLFTF